MQKKVINLLVAVSLTLLSLEGLAFAELKPYTDISDWIQAELDDHSRCVIPAGVYFVDKPLVAPFRSNVKLIGAGKGDVNLTLRGNPLRGDATYLVYRGPAESPMLTFQGSDYHAAGINFSSPGKEAALGLLITKRTRGLGSGGEFRNCSWNGFQTAAQIGETPEMHNCDNTHWFKCDFFGENGIHQKNQQAMRHVIDQCRFYCNRSVLIDAGGTMNIEKCTSYRGTLLTFTNAAPGKYRPGPNNNQFVVEDLKVDAQHGGSFVLVECFSKGPVPRVYVDRGLVSGRGEWRIAKGLPVRVSAEHLEWATAPVDRGLVE